MRNGETTSQLTDRAGRPDRCLPRRVRAPVEPGQAAHAAGDGGMRSAALKLSNPLKEERGGRTSDDATVFLIEWRAGAADHIASLV